MLQFAWCQIKFEEFIDESVFDEIKEKLQGEVIVTELPVTEDEFRYCIHSGGATDYQIEQLSENVSFIKEEEWYQVRFNRESGVLTLKDEEELDELLYLAEQAKTKEVIEHQLELKLQEKASEHAKVVKENTKDDELLLLNTDESSTFVGVLPVQMKSSVGFATITFGNEKVKIPIENVWQLENQMKMLRLQERHHFIPTSISLKDLKDALIKNDVKLSELNSIHLFIGGFFENADINKYGYAIAECVDDEVELNVDFQNLYSFEELYGGSMSSHEIRAMLSSKLLSFLKDRPQIALKVNSQLVPYDVLFNASVTRWYDFGD